MRRLFLALLACLPGFTGAATPRQPADLLITNGRVLTMNATREVIADGCIVIRGERILAVGPAALAAQYAPARTIDARGGIVMPGMVNAHTHLAMTVFRGLGDDVPDRLRRFIFPLERTFVDRAVVRDGTLLGLLELIESGVTTFADMYYFEDEVARVTRQAGLRAVLGQTIVNFPAPDSPEPYGGLALARQFIAAYREDPLITPALAPHAPYTVDARHLRLVAEASAELGAPVLIHLAEMTEEMTSIRRDHQMTPVEFLDSVGLLNRRLVAAHCIFVSESDQALLQAREVGIAHAIVANLKSAKGVAPALRMFEQGLRVGLATDGPMSGNTLDIIGQLGYVAKVHKLDRKDRNVMPAATVVEMATLGGARALHLEDRIGSLEAGKLADVVIVDTSGTALQPLYDPYSALVYAASPRDVRTTIVHGRILMEDRVVRTLDGEAIKARLRELGARIQTTLAGGLR